MQARSFLLSCFPSCMMLVRHLGCTRLISCPVMTRQHRYFPLSHCNADIAGSMYMPFVHRGRWISCKCLNCRPDAIKSPPLMVGHWGGSLALCVTVTVAIRQGLLVLITRRGACHSPHPPSFIRNRLICSDQWHVTPPFPLGALFWVLSPLD